MIEKTFPLSSQLISNGLKLTQHLLQQLVEEESVLKLGNPADKISHIAQQKQGIVSQLNQFTKQLEKILISEQLPTAPEGIEHYLKIAKDAGLNTDAQISQWTELTKLSRKCRDLNERNGACIALLSRHTQRAISIIKGKPQAANTYSPDGSASSDLISNSLISV
jgi:flagella synthesis protein FlgN